MFPKILLWEESWFFFSSTKCFFANHKTNQVETFSQNYRFTGWKRPLTKKPWWTCWKSRRASIKLKAPVRLRSGHVLKGRGEKGKAEFCSTGTLLKTPIKPVFVCRARTQSELRRHQAEGLEMVFRKYRKVNNKSKKYLPPGEARWQIWVSRRSAHRTLFLLLKKRKTGNQAKISGCASRNLRYFICCARIYNQPGPNTIANSSIMQMEEMKRIKFSPGEISGIISSNW